MLFGHNKICHGILRFSITLSATLSRYYLLGQNVRGIRLMARAILICIVVVISATVVTAVPTGLTYLDSTWISESSNDGDILAINHEIGLLAATHGDSLYLYNTTTLNTVFTMQIQRISALEFSPDNKFLAINKGSTLQSQDSLKILNLTSLQLMDIGAVVNDRTNEIVWNPLSDIIAAPGSEGDVDLLRISDLSKKTTLHDVHNVEVSCIDFRPSGEYIITGDISGRIAYWKSDGMKSGDYQDYGHEVLDCLFSKNGMDVFILDSRGKLTSQSFDGIKNYNITIKGAKKIMTSDYGNKLHVLVDGNNFKGLQTLDSGTGTILKTTSFFHRAVDLVFTEDEFGRLQKLFVTADTGQVAVYMKQIIQQGLNEIGSDFDGDLIPDNKDTDDDGDGIPDNWDNAIGCDAPVETPCSLYPDLDKIRKINIFISEGEIVIEDRLTLPTKSSSDIRNMSRESISKDQVLSIGEAQLFADSMCSNMDHRDVIEQWKYSLSSAYFELGSGNVSCKVNSGMKLVKIGDSTTQVSFSIISTIELVSKVTLPGTLTIREQPAPTDGSIAWLAPAHPVSVTVAGDGIEETSIPLWWNNEDSLNITLKQKIEDDSISISDIVDFATSPIAITGFILAIILMTSIIIRKRNSIEINIDIETAESQLSEEIKTPDEETDADIQSEDNVKEIHEEEEILVQNASEEPFKSDRKMYTSNPQNQTLIDDTGKLDIPNVDGPIMKTKRKRLVSNPSITKPVVRKKVVKKAAIKTKKVKIVETNPNLDDDSVKSDIKIRKVKLGVEDVDATMDEEPKRKKRKPVRRRSKKSPKPIDEEKIQEELVKDFLKEE